MDIGLSLTITDVLLYSMPVMATVLIILALYCILTHCGEPKMK